MCEFKNSGINDCRFPRPKGEINKKNQKGENRY